MAIPTKSLGQYIAAEPGRPASPLLFICRLRLFRTVVNPKVDLRQIKPK
jgi:hypothetical protein